MKRHYLHSNLPFENRQLKGPRTQYSIIYWGTGSAQQSESTRVATRVVSEEENRAGKGGNTLPILLRKEDSER